MRIADGGPYVYSSAGGKIGRKNYATPFGRRDIPACVTSLLCRRLRNAFRYRTDIDGVSTSKLIFIAKATVKRPSKIGTCAINNIIGQPVRNSKMFEI
jgi:hypothetical protein